jgi:hypothetical protein
MKNDFLSGSCSYERSGSSYGDVILAAQAAMIQDDGQEIIIAPTNVSHFSRLTQAKEWRNIP